MLMYTLWLPEQYRTDCRASAFAFTTSVGRFAGAGITFLVGAGVRHSGRIGLPVALTSPGLRNRTAFTSIWRKTQRKRAANLAGQYRIVNPEPL